MEKFPSPEKLYAENNDKSDIMRERVLGFIQKPNTHPDILSELETIEPAYRNYEETIPIVEKCCIEQIGLLKKFQVALRGDCMLADDLEKTISKAAVFPCARNQKARLKGEIKHLALYGLLKQLSERVDIGYRYFDDGFDFLDESVAEKRKPAILYGFCPFSDKEKYVDVEKFVQHYTYNDFFVGQGDDIGIATKNIRYLSLPLPGGKKKGDGIKSRKEFFPYRQISEELSNGGNEEGYQKTYGISQGEISLTKTRWEKQRQFFEKKPDDYFPIHLELPKTFFNLLIIAKRILADIDYYDKSIDKVNIHKKSKK